MNKKIVSLILCAAVATAGIFAANIDTANAQTTLSIEQMEQIIASLRQQIAQIVAILQARNNSTTPNGTANWLTYQDKTNGIEFEYPAKF